MLISVLTPVTYRLTLKKLDDDKRKKEISELLDEKIDTCLNSALQRGFRSICDSIDFVTLFRSLHRGDTLWWLDTYAPDHKAFIDDLEAAISRGVVVNFLILHPESANCEYRALEIGGRYDPERFKAETRIFWDQVNTCKDSDNSGGAANTRYYVDLPCVPIYLVDRSIGLDRRARYAYTSFFLNKPTGYRFPHIRWEEGEMLNHFYTYVKEKWKANEGHSDLENLSRSGESSPSVES